MLVYDFLFGPGLQCGGALKEAVMRNKSCLLSALARLKVKAKVSKNEDLLPKKVTESGTVSIVMGTFIVPIQYCSNIVFGQAALLC